MDIGARIQRARLNKGITQENAAEALGVSRQTISNWETGKTYPDIVSVIVMSDLYSISLDKLLKEENTMSNYLDYLEESTNTVKSNNKLSKLILIIADLTIWAIAIIVFWYFIDDFDAMGYGLMYLWGVLPVTIFVSSILIGKNNFWGKYKWLSALAFGVMYMLAEYATFSSANMVDFHKFNMPEWGMIPAGAIISIIGIGIGVAIRKLIKRKSVV